MTLVIDKVYLQESPNLLRGGFVFVSPCHPRIATKAHLIAHAHWQNTHWLYVAWPVVIGIYPFEVYALAGKFVLLLTVLLVRQI